jgi:hypothetical protein
MHGRVAIDFARTRLQNARIDAFGETKHIDGSHDACLDCLNRIELVMNRACGARQVENPVNFEKNRFSYVVSDKFKIAVIAQVGNIRHTARKVIIQANDFVTVIQKSFTEMTS